MRNGHFMELPELEYFTLEKAINFIYEKTNKNLSKSDILEYAINGFFQIGIEVEIVDNVLFKCGRLRISNTKLSNSTKIIHKKENQHDDGRYIYLSDKFNYISLFKGTGKIYQIEQNNEFYFTTINDCKVNCTTLIRLEPYYLRDLRGIIEQNNSICSMDFEYFSLESLARDEEDIAVTFDFVHVSPNNKTCQLKLATADLIITREDILNFIGADKKGSREDHVLEIERLKKEIEEKDKVISELQSVLDDENYPIFLNKFMENDRLALAVKARKDYWANYDPNLNNAPKAEPTAREIKEKYGLSQKQAEAIEIIACPINRN